MEIIKKLDNENEEKVIELVKDHKHLKMSLTKYDELSLSFSYDNDENGLWFQESFEIDKNDKEVYDAVNGTFLSYSGDVFFDSYGANIILFNEENKYSFFFMNEADFAAKEIKGMFLNDSMENQSMKIFFDKLSGLEETLEKPKTLSKTLNKIVEN